MLDQLPLELIQLIVRLALPSHYSPSTYRERQDTLLALCKTSRLLRTVAQPMLFEVVELKGKEGVERLVKVVKGEALGARVRDACVISTPSNGYLELSATSVVNLASRCVGITVLRFRRVDVDLATLEGFKNLRSLIVVNGILSVSRPFRLDAVVELSINCAFFEASSVLRPALFPNLRSLYVQCAATPLSLHLLEAWLVQLDCINIDASDIRLDGQITISQRILLDYTPDGLLRAIERSNPKYVAARSLRMDGCSGVGYISDDAREATDTLGYGLEMLATAIKTAATVPTTLYLPPINNSSPFDLPTGHAESIEHLLLACRERGIEVVRESAADPRYESLVSPEFWRRCKALKAREEAEKEKEAEKKDEEEGEGGKKK